MTEMRIVYRKAWNQVQSQAGQLNFKYISRKTVPLHIQIFKGGGGKKRESNSNLLVLKGNDIEKSN